MVAPNIFFFGPEDLGKTRGLEIIQALGYRGWIVPSITAATIFRCDKELRPTFCLDEVEYLSTRDKVEIIGLLNSRYLMSKPQLTTLCKQIEQRGVSKRYSIHIYSWKKHGFTKIADTLGELAAHAIAGHKAYLITYYKKSRDDRAKDYRKVAPKLQLFQGEDKEAEKLKHELAETVEGLPKERLAEILRIAKRQLKR